MIIALKTYGQTGDLGAKIDTTRSYGQGSGAQPDTVAETFRDALSLDRHGGFLQTIEALERVSKQGRPPVYERVIEPLKNIVEFLKTLDL